MPIKNKKMVSLISKSNITMKYRCIAANNLEILHCPTVSIDDCVNQFKLSAITRVQMGVPTSE